MHSFIKKTIAPAIIATLIIVPAQFAFAQFTASSTTGVDVNSTATSTSPTTPSTGTNPTPGAPNTGAGGDATTNLILLGLTGLVGASGLLYLGHKRASASRLIG